MFVVAIIPCYKSPKIAPIIASKCLNYVQKVSCIDDCCQSSDKSCDAGNVCCYSDCDDPMNPDCSYTKDTCNGSHGSKNDCMWDSKNSMCVVGL